MGHPIRRAEAVRSDRHGPLRHGVPRQLARRRGRQGAARAQRRLRAARHLQTRGGDIPQDPSREPRPVHGRLHEAAAAGDSDVTVQGHDAVHAHPPAQRQVHRQQERHRCATDISGYGLPPRTRHHSQGPENQEHLLRKRQSGDHGLRPLQCYQTLFWKQVSTKSARRQPGHPGGLAVLPGARALSGADAACQPAPALFQGHRRLRIRYGVVRAAMR